MQKRLEITVPHWDSTTGSILWIDAGLSHLHLLVTDHQKKKALAVFCFEMSEASYESITELAGSFQVFKLSFDKVHLVLHTPYSVLTPQSYQHNDIQPMTQLLMGDLHSSVLRKEPIDSLSVVNMYDSQIPAASAISKLFPQLDSVHINTLLLTTLTNGFIAVSQINVFFYEKHFNVVVFNASKPLIAHSFPLDKAEDVSYFLLKLTSAFNIDVNEVVVITGGWIEPESALQAEISKYFLHVRTEPVSHTLELSGDFLQYPEHFFSVLFKLMSCAS